MTLASEQQLMDWRTIPEHESLAIWFCPDPEISSTKEYMRGGFSQRNCYECVSDERDNVRIYNAWHGTRLKELPCNIKYETPCGLGFNGYYYKNPKYNCKEFDDRFQPESDFDFQLRVENHGLSQEARVISINTA